MAACCFAWVVVAAAESAVADGRAVWIVVVVVVDYDNVCYEHREVHFAHCCTNTTAEAEAVGGGGDAASFWIPAAAAATHLVEHRTPKDTNVVVDFPTSARRVASQSAEGNC